MAWFQRKEKGIRTKRSGQNDIPVGHWTKCPGCGQVSNHRELEDRSWVCPKCNHHLKLNALGYFELLFDDGAFILHDEHLSSADPFEFTDRKTYSDRYTAAVQKTGMNEAVRSATGTVGGHPVSAAAMDFRFIGGSMGSVVGEIVARTIKRAITRHCPAVVISQSGGARMMEGALSLMQMAKTSAQLARLDEVGLPYFSVLTNPTTGGVTASFAMLGDVNIAEPGALIGFAGPRVIRETIGQDLPSGFQSSEFLRDRGFVDIIVDRRNLHATIVRLLDLILEESVVPQCA